jgi:hypothetical protein
MPKGTPVSEQKKKLVIDMLKETDLSYAEIALLAGLGVWTVKRLAPPRYRRTTVGGSVGHQFDKGEKFGRWTVIRRVPEVQQSKVGGALWECTCECGNTGTVRASRLKNGLSTQCKPCASRKNGVLSNVRRKTKGT